mmetsp:Transcript_26994/g.51058  ORF Transcript_26994/g.51058 Transcript_26994/m.51058 type:complete len:233 (+) Transcript_26994:443-1141(+)
MRYHLVFRTLGVHLENHRRRRREGLAALPPRGRLLGEPARRHLLQHEAGEVHDGDARSPPPVVARGGGGDGHGVLPRLVPGVPGPLVAVAVEHALPVAVPHPGLGEGPHSPPLFAVRRLQLLQAECMHGVGLEQKRAHPPLRPAALLDGAEGVREEVLVAAVAIARLEAAGHLVRLKQLARLHAYVGARVQKHVPAAVGQARSSRNVRRSRRRWRRTWRRRGRKMRRVGGGG